MQTSRNLKLNPSPQDENNQTLSLPTQAQLPRGDREPRGDPEVRGDLRGGGQVAGRRLQVLPGPGAQFERSYQPGVLRSTFLSSLN